ncbi:type III restriction endonuclease subunit M [Mycobacteroides salmoniphilum]|uniref:type III restriction endonuclease subunit M n=1 Tax=Mycobacteroides salmoniphilum TaxID=404941 RepID=UPI0010E0921B|nr:type III restriction endonuclease subunit M [Mycobacteroides salmoniphilum]TDZ94281.1 hypothetical protein CCUG62472_02471 [Mycobacteroides salmoniphilum]
MTGTSGGSGGPALFDVGTEQIKNRNRVRDLAEVYTHEREVTAMLDMVLGMFPSDDDPGNHDRTFLEPSCGHGNFLVAILQRKLRTVTTARYGSAEEYEHRVLRCLASIYGIDIDGENVADSRLRLHAITTHHVGGPAARTEGFWSAVDVILATNLVRADTLADASVIELVSYQPGKGGTFIREWSTLEEPEPAAQLDLFALQGEPQRDGVPVHYADLAATPKPTAAKGRKR